MFRKLMICGFGSLALAVAGCGSNGDSLKKDEVAVEAELELDGKILAKQKLKCKLLEKCYLTFDFDGDKFETVFEWGIDINKYSSKEGKKFFKNKKMPRYIVGLLHSYIKPDDNPFQPRSPYLMRDSWTWDTETETQVNLRAEIKLPSQLFARPWATVKIKARRGTA